jgi:endonuclease YncB( thermonuclease family)
VRRLAVSVTATVLAMLGLLGMKAAASGKSAFTMTVAHGGSGAGNGSSGTGAAAGNAAGGGAVIKSVTGDTVVVTGPQVVLAHGIVQVQATLVGGRLIDVAAISLPHDNPHSWDGATAAAPKLRSEVLSKQSANVAIVSGATYTSHGYLSSLQAALDAAGRR